MNYIVVIALLSLIGAGCAPVDALLSTKQPQNPASKIATPRKAADSQSLASICLPSNTETCASQDPNVFVPSQTSWNTDAPTTEIQFSDIPLGLRMNLPFNPAWGDEHYRVTVFEGFQGNSILFGPVNFYRCTEGCGWKRTFFLQFQPRQDLTQLKKDNPKAEITKINTAATAEAYRIFTKETDFGGSEESYVVIGPKSNLLFKPGDQTTFTQEETTRLMHVISTVAFF